VIAASARIVARGNIYAGTVQEGEWAGKLSVDSEKRYVERPNPRARLQLYKSLRVAVMIYSTLVNKQTHTHTQTRRQTSVSHSL